jgi:hypothetical protein
MDRLPVPLGPSAEMPLMKGFRRKFVAALQAGSSAWALTPLFPDLVRELNEVAKTRQAKLTKTSDMIGAVGSFNVAGGLMDILMSIPRNVLESVVLGTVAFDRCRAENPVIGLDNDGPGIYVAGIWIAGRRGKFINARELKVLIEDMEQYIQGVRQAGRGLHTRAAKAAWDFVQKVDTIFGPCPSAAQGEGRFLKSSSKEAVDAARAFVESLRHRLGELEAQDPTREIWMIQSPLYVGCSNNIAGRIGEYELTQKTWSLSRINRHVGLTVSLLKGRGLDPHLQFVTAVRT